MRDIEPWELRAWAALLALATCACDGEASRVTSTGTVPFALTVPLVSSEIGTDPPILGQSSASQFNPSVASNGSGYLVVWDDSRDGGGVWASRFDVNGGLLDPTGIVLEDGTSFAHPEVAFDGASYVVLWTQTVPPKGVYAARVKPDGSVLDALPITISLSGDAEEITRGDGCSLAIWSDWTGNIANIYARRIGQDGKPMGGSATHVTTNAAYPDTAFDGSTYLVVWRDSSAIRAARLTSTAVLLDATPILVASTASTNARPSVAGGTTGFVVQWLDSDESTRLARVTKDGGVLDAGGIVLPKSSGHADVAFDGTSFLSVFEGATASDVLGTRFAPAGAFLDPAPFTISPGFEIQEAPRVASQNGEHLVVWASSGGNVPPDDVSGRRVASNGTLLGSQQISFALGANDQFSPAVASDGKEFLLVWQDHRDSSGADLYAERIVADGSVLDPLAIPLVVENAAQEEPQLTFDGTNYFSVWQDRRDGELDVYGARVDTTGKVLDPGGFPIASSAQSELFPAIATNGSLMFVTWSHGGGFDPDVHGARVTPSGKLLDPTGFVIAEGPGAQSSAAVASDGTDFLVVWSHGTAPSYSKTPNELRAARYAKDGTLLAPSPLLVAAAVNGRRYSPRLAFGNGVYLVVWHDERNALVDSADWDIYAARVTPSGDVLDANGIRVTQAAGEDVWSDVTWDGSAFVVVWNTPSDKRAARIDEAGTVLDPGGFVVSPINEWARTVRVAANGFGTTLAGYERYDNEPGFRSDRVKARTITFVDGADSGIIPDAGDASDDTGSAVDAAQSLDAGSGADATSSGGSTGTGSTRTIPVEDDSGCGCRTPRSTPFDWNRIALAMALGACGCRLARRARPR